MNGLTMLAAIAGYALVYCAFRMTNKPMVRLVIAGLTGTIAVLLLIATL